VLPAQWERPADAATAGSKAPRACRFADRSGGGLRGRDDLGIA
jgi:hypothetical protein